MDWKALARLEWKEYRFSSHWDWMHDIVEYRPQIPLKIAGPKDSRNVFGLIDSGAEGIMVNTGFARPLGIDLALCKPVEIGGVGKEGLTGYETDQVIVTVSDFAYDLKTRIIFADIPAEVLLGQTNFFERFKVLLERDKAVFHIAKVPELE